MRQTYPFPQRCRLRARADFHAVFDERVKVTRGPLTIFARPNDLSYPRLGIQTSRRVGTAVRRNRIKRLLRESFRLMQHDLPHGYDWVIIVRPHEPLMLADYQRMLSAGMIKLHNEWMKRSVDEETRDERNNV